MPTPTSLEPPLNSESTPELTLADALDAIGQGDAPPQKLTPLSDLSRADLARFRRAWPTYPDDEREHVVRALAELAENDVRYQFGRALRVALTDSSPIVRQLAVAALWEDEGSDLISSLTEIAQNDPSQDVRAEAAQGLGRFAELGAGGSLDDEVVEQLRETLVDLATDSASPYIVRRRALESVAIFGRDDEIVDLIRDAYDSDDAAVRAASLYAMGRSLDPAWLNVLVHEFASPDAEMRFEAARASGELGDDSAVPGLVDLVLDADPEVRQAAIGALGKIGGPAAVRTLRRLGDSASAVDREAIEEALDEAQMSADPGRMST